MTNVAKKQLNSKRRKIFILVVYFAVCVFPKLDEIERAGFEPTYIS